MSTIALDATYTVDPQPSGIAVYSRELIRSLAELRLAHRFLLCYRLSRWKQRREFLRPIAAPSSGGPTFSVHLFQEPLTFWLPWRAELFHSLAQRPAPFRFRREVVTIHDVFPLTGRNFSTPEFQRRFSALLLEAADRAARVITPSEYTAGQLVKHAGVARDKVRVIPEGVGLPTELASPEERLRQRARVVGEGNEMVLSLGVLQTRKNTLNALRALMLLPKNYRMVLAGGDGYGAEAIHDFIRRERLESRLVRLGHVEAARLPSLYQAASVLLFPSFDEGFGLPVLEAMAHGLAVVASRAASLPEVGGDAALYVDPHDPQDIAEKVRRVLEDKAVREGLITRGFGRAREFPWRRAAELTCRVYDEVLAK